MAYNRLFKSFAVVLLIVILTVFGLKTPEVFAEPVRVMAANITSGNRQSYDPGEGINIFQGLKPDVILIQEFKFENDTKASLRSLVDEAFGTDYQFSIEPGFLQELPNGIVSRFPILDSGEWKDKDMPNRDFAWAKIDIPGAKDLLAVSVHLKASKGSVQRKEAQNLLDALDNVDLTNTYLMIGGDFNTSRRSASAIGLLSARVDTAAPFPVDEDGNPNTNAKRKKPYDAIYVDSDLKDKEIPVQVGSLTFKDGLVFDSRVYSQLDEVSPIEASDSGAKNMQHMAVVRDFDL